MITIFSGVKTRYNYEEYSCGDWEVLRSCFQAAQDMLTDRNTPLFKNDVRHTITYCERKMNEVKSNDKR